MKLYERLKEIDFKNHYSFLTTLLLGLCFAALVAVSYLVYRGFQDRAAQKVLGFYLEELRKTPPTDAASWGQFAVGFESTAREMGASSLAPYSFAAQAQALVQAGNIEQATVVLEQALQAMSPKSLLYYLYKTEYALLLMDAAAESDRTRGFAMLLELARNAENQYKDRALYYAGYHYWTLNNLVEAKNIWQELVDEDRHDKATPSPWAGLAEKKLSYLV
jgi:tetratricopeptide (TPR) repeat protein